jgi:methyl-accepting chemotaxis protein
MALTSFIGKFGRFRFSRPRWGIRGSLFAAFAVIAGMAILISAGAGMILGQLGGMMTDLNGRDIPKLTASLQLATASESLASQGPMLLASSSPDVLKERSQRMRDTHKIAVEKLDTIAKLGADKAVVAALADTVKNIEDTIRSLGAATQERLDAVAQHQKQYDSLRAAAANFVKMSEPAATDAQNVMNDTLRATVFSAEDSGEAARVIVQVGEVVASTNLISSDLMAALSAGSSEALSPIEDNFKAAQTRVKSNLDALVGIKGTKELKEAALQLLAIGDGKNSVFKVRQKEMDTVEYGELILDETRKLNVGLGMSVKQLVDKVRSETDAATTQAQTTITLATQVMLGLGALTLIGSALFVWLYVGRSILRRLAQLQRAMQRLSSGDLDTEIARSRQQDEIAAMAGTLEVFRDSMINARTLSAEQDQDRIAKGERTSRIEARIVDFESKVRTALEKLQSSADSMQSTAQSMTATADRSSALVSAVASAAEETSVNVQTVSAGTEQLSSSINEISRQVVTSTEIAAKAVNEAGETDATMQGLGRQRQSHQRGDRSDPDHRVADQPPGAQRDHRGSARGRCRPGFRRGGFGSEEPCRSDRKGHRRDSHADRLDAAGHVHRGRCDPQHRADHRRDQSCECRHRHRRRTARCGNTRDRAQHPARRRRHQRSVEQHRRRQRCIDAGRHGCQRRARRLG